MTNLGGVDLEDTFSIFPNPVNDVFFIKNNYGEGRMQLFNVNGSLLLEKNIVGGVHEVSTAYLPQGVYWVSVKYEDVLVSKKIVVR